MTRKKKAMLFPTIFGNKYDVNNRYIRSHQQVRLNTIVPYIYKRRSHNRVTVVQPALCRKFRCDILTTIQ